jgi:hypothetical protein
MEQWTYIILGTYCSLWVVFIGVVIYTILPQRPPRPCGGSSSYTLKLIEEN